MLEELEFDETDIEQICYLVGHHHTYTNIEGIDYQILVEIDFLKNAKYRYSKNIGVIKWLYMRL